MKAGFLLPLSLLAACAAPRLDVMGRYTAFDIEGDVGSSPTGLTNSLSELNIDDGDALGFRADLDLGMPHIIVSADMAEFEGDDGTLSEPIEGLPIGATVDTDLDIGIYNALILFDVMPTKMFELGLGFGVGGLDLDGTVTDTGTGLSADLDEAVPVPLLAVNAAVQFSRFEVAALASGIGGTYDDVDVSYFDIDAFGRVAFFRPHSRLRLSALVGYRYLDIDLEYDDGGDQVTFDTVLDGPYLGLEISF